MVSSGTKAELNAQSQYLGWGTERRECPGKHLSLWVRLPPNLDALGSFHQIPLFAKAESSIFIYTKSKEVWFGGPNSSAHAPLAAGDQGHLLAQILSLTKWE